MTKRRAFLAKAGAGGFGMAGKVLEQDVVGREVTHHPEGVNELP